MVGHTEAYDVETVIGSLRTDETVVPAELSGGGVERMFRENPTIPGVIVMDGPRIIGVISRRRFFEMFGQRYGVAVYAKRPVHLMVDANKISPLIMPASSRLLEAVQVALDRPSHEVYEPILVDFGQQSYRLLDIYTLLVAQADLLNNLQLQLRHMNQALEERVVRRTAQLEASNARLSQEVVVRQRAENELNVRLKYEIALTHCANTLLAAQNSNEVLLETLHILREAVGVSRVYIAERRVDENNMDGIQLLHQVCAPDAMPLPEHTKVVAGHSLRHWFDFLWSGNGITARRDEMDGAISHLFDQFGMISLLLLPIGIPDEWFGVIGFDETRLNRDWREYDVELLQTVARMIHAYLERQRNQASIAQARDQAVRANQFKSELLAKVNHELRTPLGAILGYSQFLQYGSFGALNEEQANAVGLIIGSTNYLTALVNGLLDQAQLESGKINLQRIPFDVRQMVAEVEMRMCILAEDKGLAFTVAVADALPQMLVGDRMRLQQILINLLGNAI
ncbi:MAG: GAF domain-containing protein, partial [Anaerolineales bacterium]|nr:GAF domain-containing protein [Anaerolineales bacterium]